jgi:hypothetical protein
MAMGKVKLNEIVYRLKELRDSLMLRILTQILMSYDDLIMDRLTRTKIYPSKIWRTNLAIRIAINNKQLDEDEINFAV